MNVSTSSATPTAAQVPVTTASPTARKVAQGGAQTESPAAGTTVSLSAAALAALAAEREASETPAQTAQEARGNDRQAQRLVARQAAEKLG